MIKIARDLKNVNKALTPPIKTSCRYAKFKKYNKK